MEKDKNKTQKIRAYLQSRKDLKKYKNLLLIDWTLKKLVSIILAGYFGFGFFYLTDSLIGSIVSAGLCAVVLMGWCYEIIYADKKDYDKKLNEHNTEYKEFKGYEYD